MSSTSALPCVEIVEQPASKALRFRYECEGRSAGSIPGVNSGRNNKSYPAIRVVGYRGRAVAVVSCVTKDEPYRPHPHNLVGREVCKRGVCTVEITSENMTVSFANLGIQCVKKKDIEEALRVREEIRVDPFKTGFEHRKQPTRIDLNAVRLCFQVFLEGSEKGKFTIPLAPVVSNPIYDKKTMSDLMICKLSHCSASVAGGLEMILLCEKVIKEDIQVKFYEEHDGLTVWEGYADFKLSQVHKQVAIAFRTPRYRNQQIDEPVQVFIQLRRPSDKAFSEPLPFQMLPLGAGDPDALRRKRQKFNTSPNTLVLRHLQAEAEKNGDQMFDQGMPYNFNLVKANPMENMFGAGIAAGTTTMYPTGTTPTIPPLSAQGLRPRLSPKRTPSPMDFKPYNAAAMQDPMQNLHIPYTGSPQPILQPLESPNFSHQMSYEQPQLAEPMIPIQVPVNQSVMGLQPLIYTDGVENNMLDLDSHQYRFDMSLNQLDSAELALFDTALSENLSSGLSISDPIKIDAVTGSNAAAFGEATNMSDSFTRMANNTIREICTLNNIYKPMNDSDI